MLKQQNAERKMNFPLQEESYAIRGACFEVYKELGPGFLESVYQECLSQEFREQGIPFSEQEPLQLQYKGHILKQTYIPDFVCYGNIIVEIKGISRLAQEHRAQLLNYLKATKIELGLLVNFGHYPRIEIERLVRS